MNVLLVTPADQAFGGVASVVGNLARHLERAGHRVVFFFPGPDEVPQRRQTAQGFVGYRQNLRSPFIANLPLRAPLAFLAYLIPTLTRLRAVLRAERIDIVNIHYPLDGFVAFAILQLVLRYKVVVSVHGTDMFPMGQRQIAVSGPVGFLMRRADAVVAPSHAFLRDCVTGFGDVASHGRAIHNGVDFEDPALQHHTNTRPGGAPYLLCIADHNHNKALDVLLRAFAAVRRARPELRLLMAGDGPLRGQMEQLAQELSLSGSVEFLGWRPRAEVGALLQHCEVFVLPSRAEPFGMVVVEALAHGRPVVASAVGGIPEIVEHERSGILVPPDDPDALAAAILRVLNDDTLRAAITRAGQTRAKELFGSDTMGRHYLRLYEELLQR